MLECCREEPLSGETPQQLVILLHGVGADANDLIGLAPYFAKSLPDAIFVSPNAPFAFDMAPFGYQWFSLADLSPRAIESGVRHAAPILENFILAEAARYTLPLNKVALLGFSQGTMMSLHVGLRLPQRLAGILGYSGMLAAPESLAQEIKSRPSVMLVHGQDDDVLPPHASLGAHKALSALDVDVRLQLRPDLGHGIDPEGIEIGRDFLSSIFVKNLTLP